MLFGFAERQQSQQFSATTCTLTHHLLRLFLWPLSTSVTWRMIAVASGLHRTIKRSSVHQGGGRLTK